MTESAPVAIRPGRGPASLAALVVGVIYGVIALPAVAIGIFLFRALGSSLERSSAGSPEGATGGVLLTLIGWAGGGLAVIAAIGLLVAVSIVAMSVALRRGNESMRIPLVVLFAIAAIAKIGGVVALHAGASAAGYVVWALIDGAIAVGLLRENPT